MSELFLLTNAAEPPVEIMPARTRSKTELVNDAAPLAPDSSVPLHIQVRETIRRQVKDGVLIDKTGRLMTEAELGRHFGVSRITIRNAIKPLVDEGIFERERGRGTFLRTNQPENWVGRLMGFSETIKDAGYRPGAKVLLQGMTNKHDAEVRNQLQERAVWQLKRVRLADDIPIAPPDPTPPCPCCGGHMVIIQMLERLYQPRAPPTETASTRRYAS